MSQELQKLDINKEIGAANKDTEDVDKKIFPTTYPSTVKKPTKRNTNKPSQNKKKSYPSKTTFKGPSKKVTRHLIVGKHINSESGFSFACSESYSFREILIDFAKTIDQSSNKTRSALFADILSNLTNSDENVKMSFLLLEEMFGYKVLLISEISKLYYGKDFLAQLKKKLNDTNEPLPF